MSQAGLVDIIGSFPVIPILFDANSGSATPAANILNILGSGVITTTGAGNTITISATGTLLETLTGNSGGAVGATANNINTLGTGSITIVGNPGTSTLTTQLTGLTNHAVLIGAGTATITNVGPTSTSGQVLQSQGAAADPAFSTATYPATTTINQLLYSSSANTVAGLATANRAVLTTGATGIPVLTALATDGQLIIGSTAGVPAAATLTAGSGITITNASNSITIAVTSGSTVVETLTGNTGGAISPTAGNINTVGTGSITIAGAGSTLTTQLTGLTNHNVLVGAGTATITNVAPSATSGVPLISQGAAADPVFGTAVVAGGGTGDTSFTAYAVICGGTTSTGALQSIAGVGTSGQVLTSNGAGALPTFQAVSASGAITTITGNSGGAESPTAGGNFNILGTGSITVAGSANTETVQLTGLTNHAVLVGAGTATITNIAATANTGAVLQNNSGADPSYSTATYPSTTTINQILYSSAANTVTGLATANRAVLTTTSAGVPVVTALASDGQLIIGSTAGAPAAATLTAGTGITISNASNSITITATGAGFTWTDKSTSFNAVAANGYFVTANATATMPASPSQGDTISFVVDAAATTVTITGNTGQVIRIGSAVSAAAGTAANNARGDSVTLVYRSSDTAWIATSVIGTWTVT